MKDSYRLHFAFLFIGVWIIFQLCSFPYHSPLRRNRGNYFQFDNHFNILPIGRTNKHSKGLDYWIRWLYEQPVSFRSNKTFTLLHFDSQADHDQTHDPIHQCSPSQLIYYEQFVHESLRAVYFILDEIRLTFGSSENININPDNNAEDAFWNPKDRSENYPNISDIVYFNGYFKNFVWVYPDHWLNYSQKYIHGLNYHYLRKIIYYQKFFVYLNVTQLDWKYYYNNPKFAADYIHYMELQCSHLNEIHTPCNTSEIAEFFETILFNTTSSHEPIQIINKPQTQIKNDADITDGVDWDDDHLYNHYNHHHNHKDHDQKSDLNENWIPIDNNHSIEINVFAVAVSQLEELLTTHPAFRTDIPPPSVFFQEDEDEQRQHVQQQLSWMDKLRSHLGGAGGGNGLVNYYYHGGKYKRKNPMVLDVDLDFFSCLDPSEQILDEFGWNHEIIHKFNHALEHHQYNPTHMIQTDSNIALKTLLHVLMKQSSKKKHSKRNNHHENDYDSIGKQMLGEFKLGIKFNKDKKYNASREHHRALRQHVFQQSSKINSSNLIKLAVEEEWTPQVLREALYHSYRFQIELNKYYQVFTMNDSEYNHFVEHLDHFENIHSVIDERLKNDVNHDDISQIHHTKDVPHIMLEMNPLLELKFNESHDPGVVRAHHHKHVAKIHEMHHIHSLQSSKNLPLSDDEIRKCGKRNDYREIEIENDGEFTVTQNENDEEDDEEENVKIPNVKDRCHQHQIHLQHQDDVKKLHKLLDFHKQSVLDRHHTFNNIENDHNQFKNDSYNEDDDEKEQDQMILKKIKKHYKEFMEKLQEKGITSEMLNDKTRMQINLSPKQQLFFEYFLIYLFNNNYLHLVSQPSLIQFQKELNNVKNKNNYNTTYWLEWFLNEEATLVDSKENDGIHDDDKHKLYDPMQHEFHQTLHEKLVKSSIPIIENMHEYHSKSRRDLGDHNKKYNMLVSYPQFLEIMGVDDTRYLYHDAPETESDDLHSTNSQSENELDNDNNSKERDKFREFTIHELDEKQQHFLHNGDHSVLEKIVSEMKYKQKRLLSWMIFCSVHGAHCEEHVHPLRLKVKNPYHNIENVNINISDGTISSDSNPHSNLDLNFNQKWDKLNTHTTAMHHVLELENKHHKYSRHLSEHRLGEIDWGMINSVPTIFTSDFHNDQLQFGMVRHMFDSQWLQFESGKELKHLPSRQEINSTIKQIINILAANKKFNERFELVGAGVEVSFAHIRSNLREWLECAFVNQLEASMYKNKHTFVRYQTFLVQEYEPFIIVDHPKCVNHLWWILNGIEQEDDLVENPNFGNKGSTKEVVEPMSFA